MQGDLSTSSIGREGENAALRYLESKGFTIIFRNFRTPAGEIDIIAEKDHILHFLEVKSRHGSRMGNPLESLTPRKRKKIRMTAEWFLAKHKEYKMPCLFGAIGVELSCNPPRIECILDAFE
jgi:putative endonuclease